VQFKKSFRQKEFLFPRALSLSLARELVLPACTSRVIIVSYIRLEWHHNVYHVAQRLLLISFDTQTLIAPSRRALSPPLGPLCFFIKIPLPAGAPPRMISALLNVRGEKNSRERRSPYINVVFLRKYTAPIKYRHVNVYLVLSRRVFFFIP
jgi:hypothetical protein